MKSPDGKSDQVMDPSEAAGPPKRTSAPWRPEDLKLLGIRTHAVLCLGEAVERLNLTLVFEENTRASRTGDGKTVEALTCETVLPPRI